MTISEYLSEVELFSLIPSRVLNRWFFHGSAIPHTPTGLEVSKSHNCFEAIEKHCDLTHPLFLSAVRGKNTFKIPNSSSRVLETHLKIPKTKYYAYIYLDFQVQDLN